MAKWSARQAQMAVAAAGLLVLAAVAAGAAFGALNAADPYARPGRLVRLPDHRALNFRCEGHGSPTVLLEAGFGGGSNAWGKVAPRIAQVTRVCAYDRAGYGFSDPGPMPRDGAAIARDLDAGLTAAHIAGPYVVVGHSAGGLYARLFAARRIKDVVGLVFVDSSVEHQTQRMQALFGPGAGGLEGPERRPLRCLKLASAPHVSPGDPAFQDCARPSDDDHAKQIALNPETWRTQVSELDNLFTTTSDEVDRVGGLLEDIPAIVLTAASADGPAGAAADPGAGAWQTFHQQLAAGFHKGDHRLVKSSHLMMIDRPEVVADAALELVQAARKP
ncbi:alpha/beta hydrolase [Phenylobacterium sp.]|uniref:alpha/beta fold hydrolase n=1 Tax=Phenylobacterium sp. TaxID=1871053 RepID=UPI00120432EE|nr:alpha/beta hydrolase [Phenylobacterium sp.]THD63147.1 MAG: alpha/beta hydrolase [Phenylobacterium sp.]